MSEIKDIDSYKVESDDYVLTKIRIHMVDGCSGGTTECEVVIFLISQSSSGIYVGAITL